MKRTADKPLVLLSGMIKSPPFSEDARKKAGFLIRLLQQREVLSMPDSKPMQSIGVRCHELRIIDPLSNVIWRIIYRIDSDAILIVDVFAKKTQKTPRDVIWRCRARLKRYDKTVSWL